MISPDNLQKDVNEVTDDLNREVNDFRSDIDRDVNEVKNQPGGGCKRSKDNIERMLRGEDSTGM